MDPDTMESMPQININPKKVSFRVPKLESQRILKTRQDSTKDFQSKASLVEFDQQSNL